MIPWGHPLAKNTQYNHSSEGRLKPPICPGRIEVGDPSDRSHTLFLHVFEIVNEQVRQPTEVHLLAPAEVAIGSRWQVRFNPDGPLGGSLGDKPLATNILAEAQYQAGRP